MTALLYRWPVAAKFGRTVPKVKFYEHGTVPGAVRDKFVTEVQRIIWTYKLAQSTINLPGNADVPEIQVFQIDTKGDDVGESVLAAIDKAVKTPIIFEIVTGEGDDQRVRMAASHKQVGAATPKLSAYYTTDWQSQDAERQPLPTAISLPSLYTAILAPLTPVSARPGEELSDVAARLQAVRKLEREVAALERKLRAEPQLNRKLELRRTMKTKQAELEQQR
ncbi:DUF4391 domain-containing protein [Mycobacterium sp. 852002-10029_SCH5224772]|uniref:DUF4391 domain-containing protein n=1 Tax=Mycobacterium sp. 852002-10029_SCH5224772 TaxID=1834083 RepID=UPI0007FEA275|nr:DUF4391 domain-containing protein [Mycobacterium sp. 852002-10029_SCH5224772]OBE99002.1 hypothetical protein A5775_07645 [Mycobacterium sp. 852002-10029_SCH5224772]